MSRRGGAHERERREAHERERRRGGEEFMSGRGGEEAVVVDGERAYSLRDALKQRAQAVVGQIKQVTERCLS